MRGTGLGQGRLELLFSIHGSRGPFSIRGENGAVVGEKTWHLAWQHQMSQHLGGHGYWKFLNIDDFLPEINDRCL